LNRVFSEHRAVASQALVRPPFQASISEIDNLILTDYTKGQFCSRPENNRVVVSGREGDERKALEPLNDIVAICFRWDKGSAYVRLRCPAVNAVRILKKHSKKLFPAGCDTDPMSFKMLKGTDRRCRDNGLKKQAKFLRDAWGIDERV
jgi:hypothetical protein